MRRGLRRGRAKSSFSPFFLPGCFSQFSKKAGKNKNKKSCWSASAIARNAEKAKKATRN
jgi:hypothetical protein